MPDCLFSGFRVPITQTVSSVLPDHHQSAAAVLCPAGQELPVLLREGEDSECDMALRLPPSLSAPHRFTALWTLPSLRSRWIFYLPLPTFRLLPRLPRVPASSSSLTFVSCTWYSFFALSWLPQRDSFASFSSRACWWTTSSRWGSCWRRCLNPWGPNRWDAAVASVLCPGQKTAGLCELWMSLMEQRELCCVLPWFIRAISVFLAIAAVAKALPHPPSQRHFNGSC